jgi:DNA-binding NarL/FixJ family response regulator
MSSLERAIPVSGFVPIGAGTGMSMSRIRVLLVDDDEHFAASLAATLACDERVEVIASARDGAEAVARCSEIQPDVVAMDIHMPAMGGVEATRRIRAEQGGAAVILISGSMFSDARDLAVEAGAAGYLTKAQCARELLPAILEAAQRPSGPSA